MRENYSIRVFNNLAINTEKALSVKVFYCLKGNVKSLSMFRNIH